jgi:acetyl-CoA/propionyl-CoA carboxylase biotin carboxyl carrier protein
MGGQASWTTHRLRTTGHEPVTVSVRPTVPGTVAETTDNPSGIASDLQIRLGDGAVRQVRADRAGDRLYVTVDGLQTTFAHTTDNGPAGRVDWLAVDGDAWPVHTHDPVADRATGGGSHHGGLTAPMPGTVTVVKTSVGDPVKRGQTLLVLEAMKMEHVITAPHDGTVSELRAAAGATVAMDELLAVVTPAGQADGEAAS